LGDLRMEKRKRKASPLEKWLACDRINTIKVYSS
jgi:hypothetical protein